MVSLNRPPVPSFGIEQLDAIADRAQTALSRLRNILLDPWPRKTTPMLPSSRVAEMAKISVERLNYLIKYDKIPAGATRGRGRIREYTIEEAQHIVRVVRPYGPRPKGKLAAVLGVGNFKGGVGKTTNAVALAQGLTLHGHRVLLIDLDPQASATTLMGYLPDAEVSEEHTVMPLVYGEQPDMNYAIKPSYWPNLDFVPSSPTLFGADFYLPTAQSRNRDFQFWSVVSDGLKDAREQYDVIVIDTPPTLSYLAIAAFMACDGVIVPLPPETMDYCSSTQFFRQFAEMFKGISRDRAVDKEFAFIKVFLSKVKETAQSTSAVRGWIRTTYPDILGSAEVLESDVVKNASAQFKTVYDLNAYEGSAKTFNRARAAFDAMVAEVEEELQRFWTQGED